LLLSGIGEYSNVPTVTYDTPLIKALHLLIHHRISAIPIVDNNGAMRVLCEDLTIACCNESLFYFDDFDFCFVSTSGAAVDTYQRSDVRVCNNSQIL